MKYNFDCEKCNYQMEVDISYDNTEEGINFELEEDDEEMDCPICGETVDLNEVLDKNSDDILEQIESELAERDSAEQEFARSQRLHGRD